MANTTTSPADAQKQGEVREADRKKSQADLDTAQAEYSKLDQEHKKLQREADLETDPAKKGEASKKANEAWLKADDAHAKAAEAERNMNGVNVDATVADANVLGYGKNPGLPTSHHLSQKFGNDPANPRPKTDLPEVTDKGMVRLQRTTPDSAHPVYTTCHPDLVGDYMRAGWNRSDEEPIKASSAAPRETSSDGTTMIDDHTGKVINDDEEYVDDGTGTGNKVRRNKVKA